MAATLTTFHQRMPKMPHVVPHGNQAVVHGYFPADERYFSRKDSVRIGPYLGHLEIQEPCRPHAAGPVTLFFMQQGCRPALAGPHTKPPRMVVRIDGSRGILQTVFDRLFRGIRLDGTRKLTDAEAAMFGKLEKLATEARTRVANASAHGGADGEAVQAQVAALMGQFEVYANPEASVTAFRTRVANASRHGPDRHAAWNDIAAHFHLPAVTDTIWNDSGLLGRVLALCPDEKALLDLATTCKPRSGSPTAGVLRLTSRPWLMWRYVQPLLLHAVANKNFEDAIETLKPFSGMSTSKGHLFMTPARRPQNTSLWCALRRKGTDDAHLNVLNTWLERGAPA